MVLTAQNRRSVVSFPSKILLAQFKAVGGLTQHWDFQGQEHCSSAPESTIPASLNENSLPLSASAIFSFPRTCLSLQTSQHFLSEMSIIIAVNVLQSLCALSFPVQNCSFGLKELPLYFQRCEGMKKLGKPRDFRFLLQSIPQEAPLIALSLLDVWKRG